MTEQEKKEALNKKYESLKEEAKNNIQQADNTYDDGTKVFLSKEECMDKGIECHTEKQWGRDCKNLPPFIIKRLPVRYCYNNNWCRLCLQEK